MSNRVAIVAVAAAAALVSVGTARAADYIIEEPVVEYHPAAYYARADCAWAINQVPTVIGGNAREHWVQKNGGKLKVNDGWACGVGLGVRIHQNVRVDATFEWRSALEVTGTSDPNVAGSVDQEWKVDTVVGLVNVYYDIGNYYGFTPYIGAGVGFAQNETSDVLVPQTGFFTQGATKTDLAWALMAGASYDLDRQWTLDAGYRYINWGDATSDRYDSTAGVTPHIETQDMDAHEIRLGVRYNFW